MRALFALLMIVTLLISLLTTAAVFGQMTTTSTEEEEERTNALSFLHNIQTQQVRVGDIYISYKIFGKGDPLLLIPGFAMTMDGWDPVTLYKLSSNHTIIIFDNRGLGKTTVGTKTWSIEQFANDTAGLIDALGIKKPVDLLGLSWGGYVAQELTLMHPQKVSKLILYGTDCGGNSTILSPEITPEVGRSVESGNATIDTLVSLIFPEEWIKENAAYIQEVFSAATPASQEGVQQQAQTTYNWQGACDRLSSITKPTLVIVGTDDIVRPPANSIMLAERIPGAWLVQISGGGHAVMFQYPEQFTAVLETFLSVT